MDEKEFNQKHWEEGHVHFTRSDLASLTRCFGEKYLAEAVLKSGFERFLEVGPGQEYRALRELATVKAGGRQILPEGAVWGADPEYGSPSVRGSSAFAIAQRVGVQLEPKSVEEISLLIRAGQIAPFQFVFCRGVASMGGMGDYFFSSSGQRMSQGVEKCLGIIRNMTRCLDQSPESLIMVSTKLLHSCLPFREEELRRIGLEVVYADLPGLEGELPFERLVLAGVYPETPKEDLFQLAICKRE